MPEDLHSKEDNGPVVEGEAATAVLEAEPEIPDAELESFAREHEVTGEKMVQAKVRAADERLDQMQRAGAIPKEVDDTKEARDKHNQRVQVSLEQYKNEVKELRAKKTGAKEASRETPQEASDSEPKVLATEALKEEKAAKAIPETSPDEKGESLESFAVDALADAVKEIKKTDVAKEAFENKGAYERLRADQRESGETYEARRAKEAKEEEGIKLSPSGAADEYVNRFGGAEQETTPKKVDVKEEAPKPEPTTEQVFNGTEFPFQAVNQPVQESKPQSPEDIKSAEEIPASKEKSKEVSSQKEEKQRLVLRIAKLRKIEQNASKKDVAIRAIARSEMTRLDRKLFLMEKEERARKEAEESTKAGKAGETKKEKPAAAVRKQEQAVGIFESVKLQLRHSKALYARYEQEASTAEKEARGYGAQADSLEAGLSAQRAAWKRSETITLPGSSAPLSIPDKIRKIEEQRQAKIEGEIVDLRAREAEAKERQEIARVQKEAFEKSRDAVVRTVWERAERERRVIEKELNEGFEKERIIRRGLTAIREKQNETRGVIAKVSTMLRGKFRFDFQKDLLQDAHNEALKIFEESRGAAEELSDALSLALRNREALKEQLRELEANIKSLGIKETQGEFALEEASPTDMKASTIENETKIAV